jgi:hypothetical protein
MTMPGMAGLEPELPRQLDRSEESAHKDHRHGWWLTTRSRRCRSIALLEVVLMVRYQGGLGWLRKRGPGIDSWRHPTVHDSIADRPSAAIMGVVHEGI